MRRFGGFLVIGIFVVAVALACVVASALTPAPKQASSSQEVSGTWMHPNLAEFSKSSTGADVASDVFRHLLAGPCPKIADLLYYASDVKYSWDHIDASYNYRARAYGWKTELELTVIIKEQADLAPEMRRLGAIWGDHAFFNIGIGRKPGIAIDKATSRYACNLPTDSSDTVLIPDPWIATLVPVFPPI